MLENDERTLIGPMERIRVCWEELNKEQKEQLLRELCEVLRRSDSRLLVTRSGDGY